MRRFVRPALPLVALVLIAGAAACGGNDERTSTSNVESPPIPARSAPESSARPRVVALGDSLTAGLGLIESDAYPALLQRRIDEAGLGYEVVNAGVSGDTSAGGLRRLDWALDGDVKVLILALGANDGLRGLPVERMKENLETIITRARGRGIRVILAGMEAPPNYGPEYTAAFRQAYRDLAREHDLPFVPFLLDRVAGQSHLNQGDGIHPNPQGAAIMADTVWSVLRPVLEQMQSAS